MVMFRKNENWNFLEISLDRDSLKNNYGAKEAIVKTLSDKYSSNIDIIHFEIIDSNKYNISILVSFAIID